MWHYSALIVLKSMCYVSNYTLNTHYLNGFLPYYFDRDWLYICIATVCIEVTYRLIDRAAADSAYIWSGRIIVSGIYYLGICNSFLTLQVELLPDWTKPTFRCRCPLDLDYTHSKQLLLIVVARWRLKWFGVT